MFTERDKNNDAVYQKDIFDQCEWIDNIGDEKNFINCDLPLTDPLHKNHRKWFVKRGKEVIIAEGLYNDIVAFCLLYMHHNNLERFAIAPIISDTIIIEEGLQGKYLQMAKDNKDGKQRRKEEFNKQLLAGEEK